MLSGFLVAAALVFTDVHAERAYDFARDLSENHTPRDAGTVRGKLASNWILDTASASGLEARRDTWMATTPRGRRRMTNIVAEFKGSRDAPWVVVVSHYDTKPGTGCPGANDGASTSGLLLAIGEMINSWHGRKMPRVNVMLIWTDGEECMLAYGDDDGLWGSKRAAGELRRRGCKVEAMICLDMLGDEDLSISMPENCDGELMAKVEKAAATSGVKVSRMSGRVKDDHVPFASASYPAVDLIDFEYPYWHTPEDTMEHVSKESLKSAGRLVAALLCDLME